MRSNKKDFEKNKIEYVCKKGQTGLEMNQDNFFCIADGNNKFFGLFDGHGINGNKISNFVMGAATEYLKNSSRFRCKDIDDYADEEINKIMRKCFRYAQDKAKEQFQDFLIDRKKKERGER